MKALFLVGRIGFGAFFVYNGVNHLIKWRSMAQYAGAKKVPQPEAAVIGTERFSSWEGRWSRSWCSRKWARSRS